MSSEAASAAPQNVTAVRLSAKIQQIVASVEDPPLRGQVEQTSRLCAMALSDLRRIHLPQDYFEDNAEHRGADDKRLELAPYVLAAIAGINRLLAQMAEVYPAPEQNDDGGGDEFDFEFDLVDGPSDGGGSADAPKAPMTTSEQIADAACAFGGMLRSRVLEFGSRLEGALGQQGAWPVLAEVDDYQHRLSKAVQGVLFGMLAVLDSEAAREEILPEYKAVVSDSIELRTAISGLSYHISKFNERLGSGDADDAVPLLVGVADRLTRFAARPAYRTLRAEDKKVISDFRQALHRMRHDKDGFSMGPLRRHVEGFSKFLESMSAINHREVLVLNDQTLLEKALGVLQGVAASAAGDPAAARVSLDGLVASLAAAYGRSPELDVALREYTEHEGDGGDPAAEAQRWLQLIQGALAVCG